MSSDRATPAPQRFVGSVVIPAHDEAASIGRCLDALFDDPCAVRLEVVVACNGCTDGTAEVVRSRPYEVKVLELAEASKPAALRAAERVVASLPRLFLDADVALPARAAVAVVKRLAEPGALAARPPVVYDDAGASTWVRSYYRARARTPELMSSLWGAGVFGLSAAGRSRFGEWPDVIGDDLFADGLFERHEIEIVAGPPVVVTAPRGVRDLLAVLRRSYRGQREAEGSAVPPRRSLSTLRGVLATARGPRSAWDAAVLLCLVLVARARASRRPTGTWERDDSSRQPVDPHAAVARGRLR